MSKYLQKKIVTVDDLARELSRLRRDGKGDLPVYIFIGDEIVTIKLVDDSLEDRVDLNG